MSKLSMGSLPMKQSQLKKKLLNTYDSEMRPMESFKSFLDEIIKYKSSLKKSLIQTPTNLENPNSKILKLQNEGMPISPKNYNKNRRNSVQEREDDHLTKVIQENKEKNQGLINSCKKMKQKLHLEKVDSAMKFYKHKVKPFSGLTTFINAKEFLEKVNPVQNAPIFHDSQYKQQKTMHTLQKLHRQSIVFFDNKNKEFLDRLDDLNKRKTDKSLKKIDDYEEQSNFSLDSSFELVIKETKKPINQTKVEKTLPIKFITEPIEKLDIAKIIEKPPDWQKINRKQKSIFQINNLKSMETVKKEIIRTLIKGDEDLNKKDFEIENENIIDDNMKNEFYSTLSNVLEKEKHVKLAQLENFDKELESLLRLEKVVSSMIIDQSVNKKSKSSGIRKNKMNQKYKDFQDQTAEIIKMIGKTSRTLLNREENEATPSRKSNNNSKSILSKNNEKSSNTKSINSPKAKEMTSFMKNPLKLEKNISVVKNPTKIQRYSMFYKRKSLDLPISELYKSNFKPLANNINYPISNPALSPKNINNGPFKSYYGLDWRKSSLSQSPDHKMILASKYTSNKSVKSMDLNNNNKNEMMMKMNDIIRRTNDVSNYCVESRSDLQKITTQSDDFYSETHKKINPALESLILTLEVPKTENSNKIPLFMKKNKKKKIPLMIL